MKHLKVAAFAASLAFTLATPAFAAPFPTEPAPSFGEQDAQALFGASAGTPQLANLSLDEMNKTQGAFSWLMVAGGAAAGAIAGGAGYSVASNSPEHAWSINDFAFAIAQGALIGAVAGTGLALTGDTGLPPRRVQETYYDYRPTPADRALRIANMNMRNQARLMRLQANRQDGQMSAPITSAAH